MTWLLVTMNPRSLSMMTPEPSPVFSSLGPGKSAPPASGIPGRPSSWRTRWVRTWTTAGATATVAMRKSSDARPTIPSLSSFASASEAARERPDSQAYPDRSAM